MNGCRNARSDPNHCALPASTITIRGSASGTAPPSKRRLLEPIRRAGTRRSNAQHESLAHGLIERDIRRSPPPIRHGVAGASTWVPVWEPISIRATSTPSFASDRPTPIDTPGSPG